MQRVASAPSTFTLYDRAGRPHAELGHGRSHFVPGSSGLRVIDRHTGEARLATTTDFVELVRLADGLEGIAYQATAFSTGDMPPQISDAWRLPCACSARSGPSSRARSASTACRGWSS